MHKRGLLFILLFAMMGLWAVRQVDSAWAQATTPSDGTVPPLVFLPVIAAPMPELPVGVYDSIPIEEDPTDRPAAQHADLNLALRGYTSTVAALNLVDFGGHTDPDAPQLAAIFDPPRLPTLLRVYQVYDWDWDCSADGCRGQPLTTWDVTLLEAAGTPTEPLYIPARGPEIHGGGYRAMVLYAEPTRVTLAYTRNDTAKDGYLVHLEDILVDKGLLALYEQLNAAGRARLPALRNGERVGFVGASGTFKLAIRDTGSFMDPRSRKDWWMGYFMAHGQR